MKTLSILLLVLFSFQALAFDLCSYQETSDLELAATKVSKNPKKFTFAEKNLIHRTIALQNFYEGISKPEALVLFNEGSNEGEVAYFELEGKRLVLVHYWPGDNEYGAFYELKANGGTKLLASVGDSFITCIEE